MTLLEKAMAEHTGLDEDKIISFLCPCDLGYEILPSGCEQEGAAQEMCRKCWNREAPDGPPRASAPTDNRGGSENGG